MRLLNGLVVTAEICSSPLRARFSAAWSSVSSGCTSRRSGRSRSQLIEFFRATPIFVQLLWVNYVGPSCSAGRTASSPRPGSRSRCSRAATSPRRSAAGSRRCRAVSARPAIRRGDVAALVFPPHRPAAGAAQHGALDRQPVHRHREIVDAGVGHHGAGPDVPVAEDREHLSRADRDPDRDRGYLHRSSSFSSRRSARRSPTRCATATG